MGLWLWARRQTAAAAKFGLGDLDEVANNDDAGVVGVEALSELEAAPRQSVRRGGIVVPGGERRMPER